MPELEPPGAGGALIQTLSSRNHSTDRRVGPLNSALKDDRIAHRFLLRWVGEGAYLARMAWQVTANGRLPRPGRGRDTHLAHSGRTPHPSRHHQPAFLG